MKHALSALLVLAFIAGCTQTSQGGEIGYIEQFSLAADRSVALQQLVPGTEDYYYYHCLHYQNTQQYARVEQLLPVWIKHFNYTARVKEIQARQALLTYSQSPRKSLDFLTRTLNLRFDHQRDNGGVSPHLPTHLDSRLITREALTQDAFRRYKNLNGFEDSALQWLLQQKLDPDRCRDLLTRLTRPDHPGLVARVLADLEHTASRGFGSLPIHHRLLLRQLDECLTKKPELLNNTQFVNIYLSKLKPSDDVDLAQDTSAQQANLDRLWQFVNRLGTSQNSLKANILYHRLVLDRARGVYDKSQFMTYIKLPRSAVYSSRKYLEQNAGSQSVVNMTANYQKFTQLPPIGDDQTLVRSYLQHFFLTETTYEPYSVYIDDTYLKHVFAETKLVHGLGDAEQWSAMLPPDTFRALKERIELDFAYTNRTMFADDEPVRLDLVVKNVSNLIVKIFQINAPNYFRTNGRQVGIDVNLDGLVPNWEKTYKYSESPLRRVARHFEFPELTGRGIYVVDFIGNGTSSRAVIYRGRLHYLARNSTAGLVLTVLDEKNEGVAKPSLWLAGHRYDADDDGTILIPYSTKPGRVPVVLADGEFATLTNLEHAAEKYQLAAGIYVDRESLLASKKATVMVHPVLYLNGTPVTLSVLQDVRLTITTADHDGISTTKEVADFKIREDRDSVCEFRVPERLNRIQFSLQATVQSLSENKKIDLNTQQQFVLNGIDQTDKVKALHFAKFGDQYVLELLGKTGESRAERPVQLTIKHRDFRHAVQVMLQSDAHGQIQLGTLADVLQITAKGPQGQSQTWTLRSDRHTQYHTLHAKEGDPIEIPCMLAAGTSVKEEVSLLEVCGGEFVADRSGNVAFSEGMLKLHGLQRGDYDLVVNRGGPHIRLKIAKGTRRGGYVLGTYRQLELRGDKPLQITRLTSDSKRLQIKLAGANAFTRVHIFATRYEPAFWAYEILSGTRDREPNEVTLNALLSQYVAGRDIGDEYRYIIDRKYAHRYPGNMLERPSLLLNPWALRGTETGQQQAAAGEQFAPSEPQSERGGRAGSAKPEPPSQQGDFANLDFLANCTALFLNQTPDKNGIVALDRDQLGSKQRVWVLAIDPDDTVCRSITLPEPEPHFVDLRLAASLDPGTHFTQQKKISVVNEGQPFRIADIRTARIEAYDSLAGVYKLLVTLSHNPTLVEFGFLTHWADLAPEVKRAKYSKYACHELNFFLYKKDRPFFQSTILPYLKNKKDKTFLDQWLVGADLSGYLAPWEYAHLNTVERILLGQRLANERAQTTRFIKEQYDLVAPDVARFNFLFDTALKGNALETSTAVSLGTRLLESRARSSFSRSLETEAVPPPTAAGAKPSARPVLEKKLAPKRELSDMAAKLQEKGKAMDDRAPQVMFGLNGKAPTERSAGSDAYFMQDRKSRRARQLYVKLDSTREWAENNYYHLPIAQQNAKLVGVNGFWRDCAQHDPARPFLSTNLAETSHSFTEMMFALAVLDLPWTSPKPKTEISGNSMTMQPAGPMVVFHEEIKPATVVDKSTPILVSQNFFRPDDRYQYVDNQRVDKFVTGEFLVQTVYGCQVVMTNPTSTPQRLDVLLQIPQGAIPVLKTHVTRSVHLDLEPFHTQTLEYYFYFPRAGSFQHYPVQVARNDTLLASAEAVMLKAVERLSTIDRQSWDYVSQLGSDDDVVKYLTSNNLQRIKLDRIAFRMQDKAFFQQVVTLLGHQHVYDHTLWSYAVKHNDPSAICEHLKHCDAFVQQCGMQLDSPLLTIDPVARQTYQHLDYKPLVNARSQKLGRKRQIVNARLLQQYESLLRILSYQSRLSDSQRMEVTYYLLLQDRIEEALQIFGAINPDKLATRLQFDYFSAYLDFFTSDVKLAGPIAVRYVDYPVDRWRKAFQVITQQLNEIKGKSTQLVDSADRDQKQAALAASEPSFDISAASNQVKVTYQNVAEIRVNYYLMDIELLFSRNPFVQQYSGQFSSIRPNFTTTVKLPKDQVAVTFDLPATLRNRNLLVEVHGAGVTRSQAYYANALTVQVMDNYGQVRVTHAGTRAPLAKVYVKVYARMADGDVRFYKDGYTDLRGRFDYTSLNTNELDSVQKFAILVLSDTDGAVVREADPPKR